MFSYELMGNTMVLLNNMVQKDPTWTKPIVAVLGYVLNISYNLVQFFTVPNSLGFSIIILTIIVKFCMLPLAFKAQKSTVGMQLLQPELDKIKKKYGDTKDPQQQQKMNMEIQALYKKNNVSLLGGCLPLFIQFPIFIALSYIMHHACFFIDKLGEIYNQLINLIFSIPNYGEYFAPIAKTKIPANMDEFNVGWDYLDNTLKVLNKFRAADWEAFLSQIPQEFVARFEEILSQKDSIENFFSISLTENPVLLSIGILIPLLAAATGFLSSWLAMRNSKSGDSNMVMQQRVMMFTMPLLLGWMTISFPAGVGIYWVTSSVFQVFQQLLMNKFYKKQPKTKEA